MMGVDLFDMLGGKLSLEAGKPTPNIANVKLVAPAEPEEGRKFRQYR